MRLWHYFCYMGYFGNDFLRNIGNIQSRKSIVLDFKFFSNLGIKL